MADLGLSSPGGGPLYYVEAGVPADPEEAAWRVLEDSGGDGEGLDSDVDRLFPDDGYSWTDSMGVRAGVSGASPFRWLGG